MFDSILVGIQVILEPMNMLFCFLGVLVGTLIGVLPGIGSPGALAIILPSTMYMTPVQAIILTAGMYYGAQYGSSTTSILLNIPGEATSVITCIDGYQMARKGRAGPALGMSAFGSFIGGTMGIFLLIFLAMPLIKIALKFGPPEYFSLMCVGLVLLTFFSKGLMVKSIAMAAFGIFLGTIGSDPMSSAPRFTFNTLALTDGIGLTPVAVGLFGLSEVLVNIESTFKQEIVKTKIGSLLPNLQDWVDCKWAIVRGSLIGFFLGVLPGGGAMLASFTSYAIEKRVSRHPERFGQGAIEGVAGPETANNAGAQGNFIPLLVFGIPCNVVMAMLLAVFVIHGITPGPLLLKDNPEVFWGLIMSMYLGNLLLLALNLPLIGLWVKLLKIPYPILFPIITVLCIIGVFSVQNNEFDIFIMIFCGILGYLMKKFEYDSAVLVLAMILGPMMENAFRQSLIIYQQGFSIFVRRPISLTLLVLAAFLIIYPMLKRGNDVVWRGVGDSEGA